MWRNIRSVVAGRTRDDTSPQLSPSALNEYFVSVGPRVAAEVAGAAEHAASLPCRLPRVGACGFSVSPIDLDTLTIALYSMRNSPACGSDGLCARALKAGFPAVGYIILHIINACLTQSDYPPSWKHSLVSSHFQDRRPIRSFQLPSYFHHPYHRQTSRAHCPAAALPLPILQPPPIPQPARLPSAPFDGNRAGYRNRPNPVSCRRRGDHPLMSY